MSAAERWALAVFCSALPKLRVSAEEGFWEDTLDMHVDEVADGGSALTACRELDIDLNGVPGLTVRGPGVDGANTSWLPDPIVTGDYICPARRCVRRANRDDQARPPRCDLLDKQMLFVRQDKG